MAIDVRQRQYAIGLRGTDSGILVTENISTCTGLVGVDSKNGVVFLFHLDLPLCGSSLELALEDLKKHVKDLSGFQLYMVGGISPRVWGFFFVLSAILLANHLWWLGSMSLFLALTFSFTRFRLRRLLRKSKVFSSKSVWFAHSTAWFGLGRTGVCVDAHSGLAPEVYSYGTRRDYERFKELKWWDFKISKAAGSA